MKFKRIFGVTLTAALMLTVTANAAAIGRDTSGYSFQAGKADKTEATVPYAGMNFEGGEQGDTSAYGYLAGKEGRTEEAAPYAGMNYEGGEQGDTSTYGYWAGKEGRAEEDVPYAGMNYEGGEQGDTAYSFRTGRIGKPWNMAE